MIFLSVSLASALLMKAPFLVSKMSFAKITSMSSLACSEVIEDLTSVIVSELFEPFSVTNVKVKIYSIVCFLPY